MTTSAISVGPLPPPLDLADIERRLARLGATDERHDIRLDRMASVTLDPSVPLKPAAVLIPLVDHEDGLSVLLTQRSADLKSHSGQVSFPGGRADPGDADPVATALRETAEEVGLASARVRLLGRYETFVTPSGYRLATVVGVVKPPLELAINRAEVEAAFEIPLALARDPAHHDLVELDIAGYKRRSYLLPWPDRLIWGITAAILVRFARFVSAESA